MTDELYRKYHAGKYERPKKGDKGPAPKPVSSKPSAPPKKKKPKKNPYSPHPFSGERDKYIKEEVKRKGG